MSSHKDKSFIYHMTSLDNLSSIVRHGLLSRDELGRRANLLTHDVADPEILAGRGSLSSMVPFHFMTRNPFDYGVIKNAAHASKRFVYLAVERTHARRNGWKIIPRHPLANGGYELLSWDEGMERIDWTQLDKKGSWTTDRECKLACMAEAVSPNAVTFDTVRAIYCPTSDDADRVAKIAPRVKRYTNPRMFPPGAS